MKKRLMIEPTSYRVAEFCQKYVISKSSFYREIKANRLKLIKRGRTTLIMRVEAERWFACFQRGALPVTAEQHAAR